MTPEFRSAHHDVHHPQPRFDDEISIERSESKISVADSVSTKSTLSTYDQFDEGPSQSKDHNISVTPKIGRHLLLPSLITSEPVGRKSSFESPTTPTATPSSFHAAQLASPRNHHRFQSKPSLIVGSQSMTTSMKPNYLISYSPRRNFVNGTSPIEVLRPQFAPEYKSKGRSRSFVPRSPSVSPKSRYEQEHLGFSAYVKPSSTVSQNEAVTREHQTKGNFPPMTRDLDHKTVSRENIQQRTREVDPLQLAQHPTTEVEPPVMNKTQPSTRDFDALLLSQQQHQMIDERIAYINQPTAAREQRPSVDIQSRDYDALLLAQRQTIGEQLASRRQQFMGAFKPNSSGLHYPTMQTAQQHVPSNQTFGNRIFEHQSQLLSCGGGGRQLYMSDGGHNSVAGYHNLSMPSAQHSYPTLTFGNVHYQQSQLSSGIEGSVHLQQPSQATRSVSFGNPHPFMSSSGVLVYPHSVGGHPQEQLWQYH